MNNPMLPRPAGKAQQPAAQPQEAPHSPQELAKAVTRTSYQAQALGALARKPDVTDKDVINSTGQAVADGHLTAADAVKFLASMPPDDQIKPWLDQMYLRNLSAAVRLSSMQAGAPVPQAQPQQAAPMPQGQMQPPQASPEPPQATNPMMRA